VASLQLATAVTSQTYTFIFPAQQHKIHRPAKHEAKVFCGFSQQYVLKNGPIKSGRSLWSNKRRKDMERNLNLKMKK